MARSLLLTCDREYFEGGRPIGTCSARLVLPVREDGSRADVLQHGWLDTGRRQLCPEHNPYPPKWGNVAPLRSTPDTDTV